MVKSKNCASCGHSMVWVRLFLVFLFLSISFLLLLWLKFLETRFNLTSFINLLLYVRLLSRCYFSGVKNPLIIRRKRLFHSLWWSKVVWRVLVLSLSFFSSNNIFHLAHFYILNIHFWCFISPRELCIAQLKGWSL